MLDGPAARLAQLLDQVFLTEAGWDPGSRMLSLPAGHRLLGRALCRVAGCAATAHGTKAGGLCSRCFARLTAGGPERRGDHLVAGAAGAAVSPGRVRGSRVPADVAGRAAGAANRPVPGALAPVPPHPRDDDGRFLADPRVQPLPALGPCNVASCARRAESEHGYCPTHYVRWRPAVTAGAGADERHWQLTEPAVSEGGQVSLRGLPPLVVVEVLFGVQQRTRGGAKITDVTLRAVCDALRRQQASSVAACDAEPRSRQAGQDPAGRDGPPRAPGAGRSRQRAGQGHLGPCGLRARRAAVVHRHHPAVAARGGQGVGRRRAAPPPRRRRRQVRAKVNALAGCRKACTPAADHGTRAGRPGPARHRELPEPARLPGISRDDQPLPPQRHLPGRPRGPGRDPRRWG